MSPKHRVLIFVFVLIFASFQVAQVFALSTTPATLSPTAPAPTTTTPTDSSSILHESKVPMMGTTQPPAFSNSGSGMAQADTFTSNTANLCQANETRSMCFVQLTATSGSAAPTNNPGCPQGYQIIFIYSNKVKNASSTGPTLIYTAYDFKDQVTYVEKTFYAANGYTCAADGTTYTFGDGPVDVPTGQSAPSSNYPLDPTNDPQNRSGYLNSVGGIIALPSSVSAQNSLGLITAINRSSYKCYTSGPVVAPDSTCENGLTSYSYWEYNFTISYQFIGCTRAAGFYPATTTWPLIKTGTGAFGVPTYKTMTQTDCPTCIIPTASSSSYFPTISICGKQAVLWKAAPSP